MAIVRPTKIKANIVVYSKWCIKCDHPDWLQTLQDWAKEKKLTVQIIRTVYRPADHERATELWANRDGAPENETREQAELYPSFIVYDYIIPLKDIVEMINNSKNKLVKGGKNKNDMQGLPKTKRSRRKNRVADAVDSSSVEDGVRAND